MCGAVGRRERRPKDLRWALVGDGELSIHSAVENVQSFLFFHENGNLTADFIKLFYFVLLDSYSETRTMRTSMEAKSFELKQQPSVSAEGGSRWGRGR